MTDDKIINFYDKAKELDQNVWACECGAVSFMIYEDGRVQCTVCDSFQNDTSDLLAVKRFTRKLPRDDK